MPEPPAPEGLVDDDYYKIPSGVSYSGQQMTNKAGLLSLSTNLGQNTYLVNDTANNTGFLYAEIKADDYQPKGKERLPLNISLVIDRSGSMQGAKLENVKKAANFLIDKLNDKDILSIVAYESNVGVLQKSTPVTDKLSLHSTVSAIETGGGTNLGGGMVEGYNQVKASYKSGYVNRVLLLSDGLANEGVTDPTTLQGIAKKWFNSESISISTFGVGNDYNENLMTKQAENGGGSYYYIKQPQDIAGIFEKEINGLLSVVAQQAKLTFKIPAGVTVSRVYGGNYEMDKGNMTVNLKDIFANETKAVLVKFKIKPGTNINLPFTTRLDFEDATAGNTPTSVENLNIMRPVTDKAVYLKSFSEKVMQQCTMFESNDMLERAMKAVDERNYDKARLYGQACQSYSLSNGQKYISTKETVAQDSIITIYNGKLKNVELQQEYERKEMQKSTKSSNYMMRTKKMEQ
jgi:Ca-activated chloride channel family protein